MRILLKLIAVMSVAAIANTAVAAGAVTSNNLLTTDEVAVLRIQRQQYKDQRTADEEQLDACRVQIKTLFDYWNGKNPTVLGEITRLAAVHAAIAMGSGAGVSAGGAWAIGRLALLPDSVFWRIAKAAPAAVGLTVAGYYAYVDGIKYRGAIEDALSSADKQGLYSQIRQTETSLITDIGQLDGRIAELDNELRPYDSFDSYNQQHYSLPSQYTFMK